MTRTVLFAALAALAFLAIPLASAQRGPPPGYTDPLVYAQDYAANQTAQAAADPAAYAQSKATPEALGNETEHSAWLACWIAYTEAKPAGMALDPVCSNFFVPPGVVDAPAEAQATATEDVNATKALVANATDAVGQIVKDPTSAPEQIQRIAGDVVKFVKGVVGGLADLVLGIVQGVADALGIGAVVAGLGLKALVDGVLALIGLPALGMKAALDGLGLGLGAASDGAVAAASGLAAGAQAAVDGLVAAATATAASATSALDAVTGAAGALGKGVSDGIGAATDAVGQAAKSASDAVAGAADSVGHAVSSVFGPHHAASRGSASDGSAPVKTGTPADRLVDRILHLV